MVDNEQHLLYIDTGNMDGLSSIQLELYPIVTKWECPIECEFYYIVLTVK